MLNDATIWVSTICVISIILNIVLFAYSRRVLVRVFNASETASELFTRLDSFQEHLTSVYELPTFYGDSTLEGLLEHNKALTTYLGQYDEIYSFTQPDLLEQLQAATQQLAEEDEEEKNPQEEK